MLKTFLKTDDAQEIILLDYWGYPLATSQKDLTYAQRLFILKGRAEIEKEMRKAEENEMKKHQIQCVFLKFQNFYIALQMFPKIKLPTTLPVSFL